MFCHKLASESTMTEIPTFNTKKSAQQNIRKKSQLRQCLFLKNTPKRLSLF
jgi:hypothetical protein